MRKLVLFAAIAWVGLVSAHPREADRGHAPRESRAGYPPCSATVTDRCIQLYERGVRAPANLARNRTVSAPRTEMAGGRRYPPCTATRKDECRQQRALARRVRMAGERG
jgi:hypothetical protein